MIAHGPFTLGRLDRQKNSYENCAKEGWCFGVSVFRFLRVETLVYLNLQKGLKGVCVTTLGAAR